jgi:hypothetical protein
LKNLRDLDGEKEPKKWVSVEEGVSGDMERGEGEEEGIDPKPFVSGLQEKY